MDRWILTVIGSDRPGLTEALSAAVLDSGGNWLESHLSRLGGLYVGSVLVELGPEGAEALRARVREVDAKGLEVRMAPAAEAPTAPGEALHLSLVGRDQPGIVHQVTAVISQAKANIEALESRVSMEAHSGAPLFHLDARLRLPSGCQARDLQAALEEVSGEIMVDLSLKPEED